MLRCNDCRPLILDHLYGLLDPPEADAVAAHLASCPECAAVRAEAARVQGLIAEAARGQFPQVRFEAPTAKTNKTPVPPVLAIPKSQAQSSSASTKSARHPEPPILIAAASAVPQETHNGPNTHATRNRTSSRNALRVATWLPWAIAAAVLLAIPGTVVPVLGVLDRAETARKNADDSTAKLDISLRKYNDARYEADALRARTSLARVEAEQVLQSILTKWVADEKATSQAQDARKVTWDVLKPAAVQPGAPNEFLLVVHDRNTTPHGRVVAEVRDQTDAVIYSQPIDYEKNRSHETTIRLPASVWTQLKPQSELFLAVSSVDERSGAKTELQDKIRLMGPVFATFLTTDKPTYQPGETVHFRSLTLDRVTFAPPDREQIFRYELRTTKGTPIHGGVLTGSTNLVRVNAGKVEPIMGPDGKPVRGIGTGEFLMPPSAPDGDYSLVLTELPHPAGYPPTVPAPVTRQIKVRAGVIEIYRKEIGAERASYSAGETVQAWAQLKLQDVPVVGAEVKEVIVEADNQRLELVVPPTRTGPDGKAHLQFDLPPLLDRGDVRLKVTFKTENGEESVADRVPVIGQRVIVEFFPEGGELVAGVENRVYVRATTPTGQPVEFSGVITDGKRIFANVETTNDKNEPGANRGIGSFSFIPELSTPIWLKLKTPTQAYSPLLLPENGKLSVAGVTVAGGAAVIGSRTGFLLPPAKDEGVVMTVPDPVTSPGQPIRVHLRSVGQDRNLVVGAYTRGRLSDTQTVKVKLGELAEVKLMGGTDPRGGVVRITVFEDSTEGPREGALEKEKEPKSDLKPVAERLVFRKPGEFLNIDYTTSGARATAAPAFGVASPTTGTATGTGTATATGTTTGPAKTAGFAGGSAVSLNITATDEKKNPVAAILYAAVVNSAVASGPKDRLLTTHFLIAGEINTPDAMENADFLLTDHPKAAESLDRVLATQGWRRFVEQTRKGFASQPVATNAACANYLVCNGQYMTRAEPAAQDLRKLNEVYLGRFQSAVKKLDEARANVEAAKADHSADDRAQQLAREASAAQDAAKATAQQADSAAKPVKRFLDAGWFAVAGFALLAVMLGTAAFVRSTGRLPLGIGTVGSLGLVAFLVFALGVADRTQAATDTAENVAQAGTSKPSAPATAPTGEIALGADTAPAPHDLTKSGKLGNGFTTVSGAIQAAKATEGDKGGFGMASGLPGGGIGGQGAFGPGFGGPITPVIGGGGGGVIYPTVPHFGAKGSDKEGKFPAPLAPLVGGKYGGPPGRGLEQALPIWPFPIPPGLAPFPMMAKPNSAAPAPPGAAPGAGTGPGGNVGRDDGWQPNSDGKRGGASRMSWVTDDELAKRKKDTAATGIRPPGLPAFPQPSFASEAGHTTVTSPKVVMLPRLTGDTAKDMAETDRAMNDADQMVKQFAENWSNTLRHELELGLSKLREPQEKEKVADMKKVQVQSELATVYRTFNNIQAAVPNTPPLIAREYAPPRPGSTPADAVFSLTESDTIFWQPVIVLPTDGKTTLNFNIGSAEGGYQVIIAGHTLAGKNGQDGRIGAIRRIIPVTASAPTALPALGPPFAPGASVESKAP
jgi:hypothetical protein